jgi:peptide/nickel transport system permease protein
MAAYVLRRGLEVIPTVFLVLTLVFLALRVMPGDPAIAALGEFATPDSIASFRVWMSRSGRSTLASSAMR